jgi:polygalacturonase
MSGLSPLVSPSNRRAFLKTAGLAGLGICVAVDGGQAQAPASDIWAGVDTILRRIVPPVFPERTFDVTKFGAVAGGTEDGSDAFRRAIAACRAAGGGRVVVPKGRFLTGSIRLGSGVNLHIEDGATIAFRTDPSAYLPLVLTRFESTELMNYSPFIYALDERDIAITGAGTLDGQANEGNWWTWRAPVPGGVVRQVAARTRLLDLAARRVPVPQRVFGEGSYLRPNFIQPYRCRNVLIEGVTIVNSPMWEINPVLCTNVTIRGVNVHSLGPNNDGCDPESCRDVLIEGCIFATGDDCIALKSGRNEDGRRIGVPIENVIIRNCQMRDGHGGVVIGSEISGGARNIFAEDCLMDSPRLDRVLRFKTNSMRGGIIERVAMRRVTVGQVAEGIIVADFFYEEGDAGRFTPILREVDVRDVTSRKSKYAFLLRGYRRSPVSDITVTDCTFDGVENDDVLDEVRDLQLTNVRVNGRLRNERITHQA